MSFSRLLVYKMGEQLCHGVCHPDCEYLGKAELLEDRKCKLYTCPECGGFIDTGGETVRVIFKATETMKTRQAYLYGKGMDRKAKDAYSFLTFHKDCYLTQHIRWIEGKLATNPDQGM